MAKTNGVVMSQAVVEVFVKKFPIGITEDVKYTNDFAVFEGLEQVSTVTSTGRHFHQTVLGFKFRAVGEDNSEAYSSPTEFELSEIGGLEFFDPFQKWFLKEADLCLRLGQINTARFLVLVETKTEFDQMLREHVTNVDSLKRLALDELNI
jgi:hypothetical protein